MCFRALAFSEADLSSLFSNSGIVISLLNLVAFLVIELVALDRRVVQYSDKFMHTIVLYYIHITID